MYNIHIVASGLAIISTFVAIKLLKAIEEFSKELKKWERNLIKRIKAILNLFFTAVLLFVVFFFIFSNLLQ